MIRKLVYEIDHLLGQSWPSIGRLYFRQSNYANGDFTQTPRATLI